VPQPLPTEVDWAGLVPAIATANAALARFDGMLGTLGNPEILLAPLGTREAVLSSRIEGTRATLEEVLEDEANPSGESTPHGADIREIQNYRRAIEVALDRLGERPFSLNLIRDIHAVLMDSVRGHDKARGEFRRVQNFIAAPGDPIEDAQFVPPPPQEVMPLMGNLEVYAHEVERDVLVQVGLIHAQFEIIHPFLDGNGRVGRILIPLLLHSKGTIDRPAFYMSGQLESKRDEYYRRLREIPESGSYDKWLRFFLAAVEAQAKEDCQRIEAILSLYERMKTVVIEETRSQHTLAVLDTLFARPVFSTRLFARDSAIPPPTAARLLKRLASAGVIAVTRPGRGRRPAIWDFPELLRIVR